MVLVRYQPMENRRRSANQNPSIQNWYDDHARSFENADAIELTFIGLSEVSQQRLNGFKLHAVEHYISMKGKNVLEFGAGHGRTALAYPEMASYKGVDYSRNLVDIGNRKLEKAGLSSRAQLVHSDVLSYSDAPDKYDVVCSLGMMCYFEDAALPVRKMVSHLKPGGDLFFDFRVDSWLYRGIRRVKWALSPPTGGYTYMLRAAEVRTLLPKLGLIDIRIVSREFPVLAGQFAKGQEWPLSLRNRMAESEVARTFATEAWVFARKPAKRTALMQ